MSENQPSVPQAIYDELTAFVFERDTDFRHRHSTTAIIPRESQNHIDTIYSDDGEDSYDISNSKRLELIARYNLVGKERPNPDTKIQFRLKLSTVTQISVLPPVLSSYFSDEQRQHYDTIEPGDLSEARYLEYSINHTIEDQLMIARHMEYELCDNDQTLHIVHDPVSKKSFERVAVAHEQRTIIVPPRVIQEQNSDIGNQIASDVFLQNMRHTLGSPELTKEESDSDAAFSIRAMLKILRSSAPIPHIDNPQLHIKLPRHL